MPAYTVGLAVGAAGGDLTGKRVAVLGAAYRGGVKETAFSGVFATVEALRGAGATSSCTTRCTPPTSSARSAGRPYRSASRPTSWSCRPTTPSTASWRAADFPGVQVVVDGRHILTAGASTGVRFLVVGQAEGA